MIKDIYAILIFVAIIVWIAVAIKYYQENKAYKKSAYGRQSKNSFWKTISNQGARGEYRMSQLLEKAPFEHKLIFNCYIPNRTGEKTELDIIMLSQKGIYVVENKNYSGWIFGDEKSKNWCETLSGKKYFFYNPIKQNKSHVKNLEKMLQIGEDKYISLITFNNGANLKKVTVESKDTFVVHYNKIKKFLSEQANRSDCLTTEKTEEIYKTLLPGTQLTEEEKQAHIDRIKNKYKKN